MSYRVRFTTHTGATGYWDGGDSDRRRLEVLERWLRSKDDVSIVWMENRCLALNGTGIAVEWGWGLADLADKLAEKEGKP